MYSRVIFEQRVKQALFEVVLVGLAQVRGSRSEQNAWMPSTTPGIGSTNVT